MTIVVEEEDPCFSYKLTDATRTSNNAICSYIVFLYGENLEEN